MRLQSLRVEKWSPYAIGLVVALAWWIYKTYCPYKTCFSETMLSSGVTYGSIAIGFLATTKAIMASIYKSQMMKDIRNSGYIAELTRYLIEAVVLALFAVVVNFAGFFSLSCNAIYQSVWFFAMTASGGVFVRIVIVFSIILRKLRDDGDESEG